jgi:L-2-hydroxyglutarate oxidase LhgO
MTSFPGAAAFARRPWTATAAWWTTSCSRRGPRSLHVLNAPSPGATASLAIGRHIARKVLDRMPD